MIKLDKSGVSLARQYLLQPTAGPEPPSYTNGDRERVRGFVTYTLQSILGGVTPEHFMNLSGLAQDVIAYILAEMLLEEIVWFDGEKLVLVR